MSELLSQRLKQILELLAAGLCQKEIADKLALSAPTVHKCVTVIFARIGAVNTSNAVYIATKRHLID